MLNLKRPSNYLGFYSNRLTRTEVWGFTHETALISDQRWSNQPINTRVNSHSSLLWLTTSDSLHYTNGYAKNRSTRTSYAHSLAHRLMSSLTASFTKNPGRGMHFKFHWNSNTYSAFHRLEIIFAEILKRLI